MRYQPRMPGSVMTGVGQYARHSALPERRTDTRILGYFGRAISLEFSSAQEYLAQAALAQARQEIEPAKGFVTLANEEFNHVALLTERLVFLGALPSQSVLKATTPAGSLSEALALCEAREKELIALYAEAVAYCTNTGAGDDASLFAQLHEEELAQLQRLGQWRA
jgi:bacterioferritin